MSEEHPVNAEDVLARVMVGADIPLLLAEAAMWRLVTTIAAFEVKREHESGEPGDVTRGVMTYLLSTIMSVGKAVANKEPHIPVSDLLRKAVSDNEMTAIGLHLDGLLFPYAEHLHERGAAADSEANAIIDRMQQDQRP